MGRNFSVSPARITLISEQADLLASRGRLLAGRSEPARSTVRPGVRGHRPSAQALGGATENLRDSIHYGSDRGWHGGCNGAQRDGNNLKPLMSAGCARWRTPNEEDFLARPDLLPSDTEALGKRAAR